MNRDPFDSLRSRNPAPPEGLPEAPMPLASRITAGRPTLRRGLAIATAAAAVVLVAGGGWLLWSGVAPDQSVPVTTGPTPTTGAAPTTTMPSSIDVVSEAVVYFLTPDHLGNPSLVPVARDLRVLNVSPMPDRGPLTVELLLAGPGAWDAGTLPDPVAAAEAGLSSAIPKGTRLLSLSGADGVATVDLSAEFAGASAEAVGQVVFTLTRLEGVSAVRFLIQGEPYAAVAGAMTLVPAASPPEEAILDDPATRFTFEGLMPLALLESPGLGGTLRVPGTITGVANPYGWRVGLSISGSEGILWETEVTATCGTPWQACRGEYDWSIFSAAVPAGLVDYGQWGTLAAFVFGEGGEAYALRSQPVWLEPGPQDGATTTTLVAPADDAPTVVVYFLDAATGAAVPVARDLRVLNVRPLPDLGPLTVELLLSGPGAWDAAPLDPPVAAAEARLTTAIPENTTLLSFALTDGTATVDLSAEFLSGDPATLNARFAQLVFTLTRLEGVQNVRVLVAGSPASPLDGEPGPLTWQDVDGLVPPAVIAYPPLGGTLHLPDIIVAASGRLTLTMIDDDGTELWTSTVVGGTDCCAAAEVPGDLVDYGRWVTLQATGSEGGAAGAAFEMPIWLAPYVPFTDEPGIPEATTTLPGLGDLTPFPPDMSAGCAPEIVRDLAAFEAALANGPLTLQDLCALVGMPDWETGSGLWIPVYDLADGSRLFLGYAGPGADDLMYANLVSPDGQVRDLLGG